MTTTLGRVSTAGARAMTLEVHPAGQKYNKKLPPSSSSGKVNPGYVWCFEILEQSTYMSMWIHLGSPNYIQIVTTKRDEQTPFNRCYPFTSTSFLAS